jgi:hypothetical protein
MYYDKDATGATGEQLAEPHMKRYMNTDSVSRFTNKMFRGHDIFGFVAGVAFTVQVKATSQKIKHGSFGIPENSFKKMMQFYEEWEDKQNHYIVLEGLPDCVAYIIKSKNLYKMYKSGMVKGYKSWCLIPLYLGGVEEILYTPEEVKIAIEYLNGDQLGFDFFER